MAIARRPHAHTSPARPEQSYRGSTRTTPGRRYRQASVEWSDAVVPPPHRHMTVIKFEPATVVGAPVDGFDAWPRFAQIASLGVVFVAAILGAGHVVAAAAGLAIGFFALALLFFGSFAAYRRGTPERLFGPHVSIIGMWSAFVVALAICINLILGT